LKLYVVDHDGVYLGGMTLVQAESEDEAKELVETSARCVYGVRMVEFKDNVFQIWDGDY
jgi:hypothetical protein